MLEPGASRAASQTVHLFFAEAGFVSIQLVQVHVPAAGAANAKPLAAQLLEGAGWDGGGAVEVGLVFAPGRSASQTVHLSFADSGLLSMQVLQVQELLAALGAKPAAAQLLAGAMVVWTGVDTAASRSNFGRSFLRTARALAFADMSIPGTVAVAATLKSNS